MSVRYYYCCYIIIINPDFFSEDIDLVSIKKQMA